MSDHPFDSLLHLFRPGCAIYVPGASGESGALCTALQRRPERATGIRFVSCLLPGINAFDYAAVNAEARMTTFLLPPALRHSFEAGRVQVHPLTYTQIADFLAHLPLDVAVAHLAPPDARASCSLGIAADFTPIAWRRARRRVAIINHAMPVMARGPRISLSEADVVVEVDEPLPASAPAAISATLDAIARRVASLVTDGATVQIGIGGAPGAVWGQLTSHRHIGVHSGMVSDGFLAMADSGALAADVVHRTGIAFGSRSFYCSLAQRDLVAFGSVRETHEAEVLAPIARFTAINSAFEVDLSGQVNLEWQNGRLASGLGGAPEFARAALRSPGGRSIVALPATALGGKVSRIVVQLNSPTVSLPRFDVDTVVTEYGIAELRGRSLDERAAALIAIADPLHRDSLAAAWLERRRSL